MHKHTRLEPERQSKDHRSPKRQYQNQKRRRHDVCIQWRCLRLCLLLIGVEITDACLDQCEMETTDLFAFTSAVSQYNVSICTEKGNKNISDLHNGKHNCLTAKNDNNRSY